LQEGFIKVFEDLHQYKFEGTFEGWMRKIMVNCSLQKFRNKKHLRAVIDIDTQEFLMQVMKRCYRKSILKNY
jgi:RNA polymerase sigma-70 factor (ECF subfamily)